MIALVAYQLTGLRRSRHWLGLPIGYLLYLVLFFLRISHHHPGSYGDAVFGCVVVATGLGWAVSAGQDRSLWQVLIVAAGSRERAALSRLAVSFVALVPLAVATALVAAASRLASAGVLAQVLGAIVLYLLAGALGCLTGTALGQRFSQRSTVLAAVVVFVLLLLAL